MGVQGSLNSFNTESGLAVWPHRVLPQSLSAPQPWEGMVGGSRRRAGTLEAMMSWFSLACSSRGNVWVNRSFLFVLRTVFYGTTSTRDNCHPAIIDIMLTEIKTSVFIALDAGLAL
ncbi:hypothetical protein E2C01_047347 [Portunus trituberculatus]|uniref:Uncharacterized protein n=1 Tax=Portunus trituberculatus TaxID=210409 RepID=A0A5B7G7P3_PORTR|nr:hypothetical protein [Portunus trituberculatus]